MYDLFVFLSRMIPPKKTTTDCQSRELEPQWLDMAEKTKFNVAVDRHIEKRFREIADTYGGQLGRCLAAAMLQFLESDPKVQADLLTRCFQAEIHEAMETLVEEAKGEQVKKIKNREAKER
jgi:hypothetical protein